MNRREFFHTHDRLGKRVTNPISLGIMVLFGMIVGAGARPDWFIRAERLKADADDLDDTQRCALGGAL